MVAAGVPNAAALIAAALGCGGGGGGGGGGSARAAHEAGCQLADLPAVQEAGVSYLGVAMVLAPGTLMCSPNLLTAAGASFALRTTDSTIAGQAVQRRRPALAAAAAGSR